MTTAQARTSLPIAKPPAPETVEAFLAAVPEPARTTLAKVRATIRAAVPSAATEVISYAIPAFSLGKPFFGYAPYKKHYSLFPFSGSFLDAFAEDLAQYTRSRGSLHIPYGQPVPVALIRKLVKARVAQLKRA